MNKKWFTLIEIIVATSILTIAVFWVYKLIWENTKIINNSRLLNNIQLLFPVIENCGDNEKSIISDGRLYYLDLWVNWNKCDFDLNEKNTIIDNSVYLLSIQYNTINKEFDYNIESEYFWKKTITKKR